MPKVETYSPESTRRRLKAAKGGVLEAPDNTDKEKAVQVKKLFRSRFPTTRVYATRARSELAVGTVGVSNLDDLHDLMTKFGTFQELMEHTGLHSRQSVHSALQDCSEVLSRATVSGVPVTRQIQFLINAINETGEPLAQLCRFFLQMAPIADRRTMATLMAVYFQIPLDSLVVVRPS